jgi:polysaccharide biosynthesis transport protein
MSEEIVMRPRLVALDPADPAEREQPLEPVLFSSVRVLRRRKFMVIALLIVLVAPAAVFIMKRPPVYQATARLLVESNDETMSLMKDQANNAQPDNFFKTQQQLIRSRPVVAKTVQAARLWESPEFGRALDEKPTEEQISRSGLVDQFLSHLTVLPVPDTHLLTVTFEASDSTLAMNAVNTLTATYQSEQAAAQGKDASSMLGWINDRLAEQRKRLKTSESAMHGYMTSNDAVSVEDRQNIVVQKLSELNTALTRAKTDRMSKEALYEQLQAVRGDPSSLGSLPVVLSNPMLQQLRGQFADLKQKELGMSQELGDEHPSLIRLRSEIEQTRIRLDAELAKLTESVKDEFVATKAIEDNLTSALNEQKREVLNLNQKSLDYGTLQRQATSDRQLYDRLMAESKTRVVIDQPAQQTIRVVEPAELPLEPTGPNNGRDLLLVFAAGLLLAIGAPLTLEALDHHIKTPADIEQRLHLPCLAMVPKLSKLAGEPRPVMTNESSWYNESFRRIRAVVSSRFKPQTASRLLITSAVPEEGKSVVALNLAIAFAKTGQRVLLLDADLRRPSVHTNFDFEVAPGFTNLLRRDSDGPPPIRGTSIPNLFVMTSGTVQSDASELLASSHVQALLQTLETRFHWIIFDSPPVGPVADACILARHVPQTLFVVAADSTPVGAAMPAIDQLKAAGATIAGVVLNRADIERSGYYYWPYHQKQYSGYYAASSAG